jgi:methionyl aminopeptidase
VRGEGFAVCRGLTGHGIGPHPRAADGPEHLASGARAALTGGLVLTIEPIVAAGAGAVHTEEDGWTVMTSDGSWAAHVEHTVVIGRERPVVLTRIP